MSFKIERNDITKVRADAIVNTANPFPAVGEGTDTAVYNAAGREELLKAREEIGIIEPGHSASTKSFNLKKQGIKYIIHTVGCRYEADKPETVQKLRSCYSSALKIAAELKCKSVAIPLLASGNYAFPKDLAFQVAVEEISRFLLENEISICLVVYDDESYKISERLFSDVEDFLCDNYEGDDLTTGSYEREVLRPRERNRAAVSGRLIQEASSSCVGRKVCYSAELAPIDVDDFLKSSKEKLNFQNTLQMLIAERKLDNATIYKKACIDKKFFSKIISNKDYVPKKHTVMALGLALELPLAKYEEFLATAGYAFMPSSKFDLIIKYCVMNQIYNIVSVDVILNDHGEECFAPD